MLCCFEHFFPWRFESNSHSGLLFNNDNRRGDSYVAFEPLDAIQEPRVRNADAVFVTSVKWCKRTPPSHHEFLVFYVMERNTHRRSVLLAERHVTEDGRTALVAQMDDEKKRSNSSLEESQLKELPHLDINKDFNPHTSPSSSKSLHHSYASPPLDELTFSHSGNDRFVQRIQKGHEVAVSLEITRECFSVSQLAVLVNLIHNHRSNDIFFDYHSSWFADIIYSVVKDKCLDAIEHKGPAYDRRGKFDRSPIRKGEAISAKDLMQEFDKEWPLHEKELESSRVLEREHRKQLITREAETITQPVREARLKAEEAKQEAEDRLNATEVAKKQAEEYRQVAKERAIVAEAAMREAQEELIKLRTKPSASCTVST